MNPNRPPVYEKGYPSYKAINGYEPESVTRLSVTDITAIQKEIDKDTSISKKSAKLIHALLKGHSK